MSLLIGHQISLYQYQVFWKNCDNFELVTLKSFYYSLRERELKEKVLFKKKGVDRIINFYTMKLIKKLKESNNIDFSTIFFDHNDKSIQNYISLLICLIKSKIR